MTSITPAHQQLQTRLQALLGPDLSVICTCIDGDTNGLWPEERPAITGAIPRRQREFAAGRAAAREAIRCLGGSVGPIPSNADRSPCWPPGLVGSISHCRTTCVAVVALDRSWQSVGVDVEPDQAIPADLWESICIADELRRISQMPTEIRERWVTRVFSAKEAYYKWVYPRIRTMLDFHDVAIELQPTLGDTSFVARPLRQAALEATPAGLQGTLTASQGLVVGLMIH